MLQMAYFERDHRPVTMDVGPVLSLEDVLGSKVCALASRVEPRDYVDTAAALERYSPAQLIGFARRLDPGLTDQDFADAGRRLDELNDRRFTAFGLSPQEIAETAAALRHLAPEPDRRARLASGYAVREGARHRE